MYVTPRLASVLKAIAAVLVVMLLALLGVGVYLYRVSLSLPDIDLAASSQETARTSIVYAADGSVLAEWHGEEDRTVVALENMPIHLRDAVVSIEDERFYTHRGVDSRAILRAFRANAEDGGISQGGSTITQQLVKILCTDGKRTLERKVREALLAFQIEARTDKDKVLETYLNTVYFGHGSYGVESAARTLFGTSASQLDLAESAMLAGLIQSPGHFSPIDEPDAAIERRATVLSKMRELGYITEAEEVAARGQELAIAPPREVPEVAPYFVEWVKQDLIERLGADTVFRGGLRVYTTLDPVLQDAAERAVRSQLPDPADPECALVAVDHTNGQVVAMVGGRDFHENQYNLASQGRRQPGSAFKPFVLVRALEEGIRPEQQFDASPYSVRVKDGVWNVQNYENAFTDGRLTLSAATNWSVNAVYARLIMRVGAEDVVETAQRMGIESPLEPNPAIALGGLSQGVTPLEMASAYGTIASGGYRNFPTGLLRVTDDRGTVVYEPDSTANQAISKTVAVQASLMLHDVVENGTAQEARIPGTWVAGKTGTTQSYRDAWFVGYTDRISCAVWVGYRDGQVEMTDVHGIRVTGGSIPAKTWKVFMTRALKAQRAPLTPVEPPDPVALGDENGEPPVISSQQVLVQICAETKLKATKRCPDVVEMYLDPTLVPEGTCERH